ncbi:MAG TPA: shikimate dehydrogenase [Candidatus Dormibacteraeota bacterium]|nr:shikimate dehydrogenase [Candidatus Dormibacteraeota bacterium]
MGTPEAERTMSARRVVLLGHGISYSASPAMQMAAFAEVGLDWTYELLDVPPQGLADAVATLRRPESAGANVTIPHKLAVMRLLDRLEGDAEAAGAVNTIRHVDDELIGSNTDVEGVRQALAEVGVEPLGAEVVVLGVGGSARAAAVALRGSHPVFVARRPEAGAGLPGQVYNWDDPVWQAQARRADLIINTTPLGRRGEMAMRPSCLPRRGAVIDLVYTDTGTPLIRRARQLGLRCADGWGVLLAQGAAAFEAWTGMTPPLGVMRKALQGG